ncbi:uncharacterized protein GLRG_07029 [Colletotrichum graminicola M1.001]|uniref:Uncharacterized protein n=1 Tax=Colletotrichum graminicola (strain M1.001 / M2 / FGSC 10212) TaxID=645133 RepID=E3QLZ7_COLGM|nr:uncharacterized protein GLRG_07029 [Colletotrichum graminicola M1.001]EFQ31885.1 hypothetical protein GLRG_07029 [Colletotrichum graminicola M1.001]
MELNPGSIVGYKPKTVDIMVPDERAEDHYMTTSTWVAFKDNVEAIGIRGIFGCTAVVFVSRRGAWVGHFWESNFQSDTVPEEEFAFRVLHEPKLGYREGHWKHQYHEYGWAELGFYPQLGDPGVMFGNAGDKYYEADLRVFIVTPRPRGKYKDENNIPLPDDVVHDINRNAGQLQFPGKIQRLSQEIKNVYGEDTKIEVIDYAAKLLKKEDLDLAMENKLTGAQIFHLQADSDFREARGKLLLQYQPAKTCADLASWRLWVENQAIGVSCGHIAANTERLNTCPS